VDDAPETATWEEEEENKMNNMGYVKLTAASFWVC
jgi:hypothetical protein